MCDAACLAVRGCSLDDAGHRGSQAEGLDNPSESNVQLQPILLLLHSTLLHSTVAKEVPWMWLYNALCFTLQLVIMVAQPRMPHGQTASLYSRRGQGMPRCAAP